MTDTEVLKARFRAVLTDRGYDKGVEDDLFEELLEELSAIAEGY